MTGRAAALSMAVLASVAGCGAPGADAAAPVHAGVETALLDDGLVRFRVAVAAADDGTAVGSYARCAAAQYALIRGYAFARHVRTTVREEGGTWFGDAVYTVSPDLPRGRRTIDAEVVVADCRRRGIPTV